MSTLPVLDTHLTDQFFTASSDAEIAELRDIFAAFVTDVTARMGGLLAGAPPAPAPVVRELHQLRGAVANFGFQRAAARLATLEAAWTTLAPATRRLELAAADAEIRAGITALRQQYPIFQIA